MNEQNQILTPQAQQLFVAAILAVCAEGSEQSTRDLIAQAETLNDFQVNHFLNVAVALTTVLSARQAVIDRANLEARFSESAKAAREDELRRQAKEAYRQRYEAASPEERRRMVEFYFRFGA